MNLVIHLLALLFAHDGVALAATAPEHLDVITAAHHVAAARVAAARHHVDADLLLSIAAHESHYEQVTQTTEVGGLVSCGVMTPVPKASCEGDDLHGDDDELLPGYDAGAAHLRGWIDATPDLRTALLGYAGGYRLIRACAAGPVYRTTGGHQDLCTIADVFLFRQKMIQRARLVYPSS